jgi:aryl-alcohol dehydrogenase-like predicted oxidoreductase
MSEQRDHGSAPDRRSFLRDAGAIGAGAALAAAVLPPAQVFGDEPDKVPQKPFGRTGLTVSAMGLGGHALGLVSTMKDAARLAHEAIDAGVMFMDNAWEYHGGRSEEWMGEALKGRRDKVFLMTKVCSHGRDRKVAMQQLNESLKRLKTDHLDLWQIHEVVYEHDPDLHFAKGGAVEALDEAKKAGKVKYVGFTGHKDPRIHLKMLSHEYPFDAVQMPLNCFDATYRSFEQKVLPELIKRGIAPIGMKSLSGTGLPITKGLVTVEEALRYAMSLPVAVTVSGIDSLEVLRQNLKIARGFKPLPQSELAAIRQRCARDAGDGHLELYKSSAKFDGAIGREQHGYPPPSEVPL